MFKINHLMVLLLMFFFSCNDDSTGTDTNTNNGSAGNLGGANTGGSPIGGSNNGGSSIGGSNNGGSSIGGSNNGGSNNGGSNNGGSSIGGSNNGGSNNGGSNNGGSNNGGSNNGGSPIAGSNNGGSSEELPTISLENTTFTVTSVLGILENEQFYFPSALSHLIGTSIYGNILEFICFDVTNNNNDFIQFDIEVEIVNYTDKSTGSLYLGPNETQNTCITPVFYFQSLQSLTQSASTRLKLNFILNGENNEQVYDINMMPLNQFSHTQLQAEFHAVFVTPNSQWVQDIQDDVSRKSQFGGFGTGGYNAINVQKFFEGLDIADGTQTVLENFYIKNTEYLNIEFNSIYSNTFGLSGEINDAYLNIIDSQGTVVYESDISAGSVVEFYPSTADQYSIVIGLYNSAVANINLVDYTRNVTKTEKVLDYLQAIFYTLREEGISYANINNFESAQTIRSPDDVIRSRAANCLEGTYTFASIAELFSINSYLILSLANGHAFYAIIDEDGDYWPIETTLVGNYNAEFIDALRTGFSTANCWFGNIDCDSNQYDENAKAIDVFLQRDNGILPIPYAF